MTVHFNVVTGKLRHFWELVGESGNYHITKEGRIVPKSFLYPGVFNDLRTASLDLSFAKKRTLKDQVSGNNLVTFGRASAGTYVDSDGLIKTSPVNLLAYSEQIDQWTVAANSVVAPNTTTAPDGTFTADGLYFGMTGNTNVSQSATLTHNKTYTFSVYAKAATPGSDNKFIPYIDSSAPKFPSIDFEATSEWVRFSYTFTHDDGTAATPIFILNSGDLYITNVYFWGAQLEEGITATDYIPTGATISGAPRFDHDPVTGESLGLLIEGGCTNQLLYSENLSKTDWTKSLATVTSNVIVAPNGETSADKMSATNTANEARHIRQDTPILNGDIYTQSVFAKAGEVSVLQISPSTAFSNDFQNFDLSTGQLGSSGTNNGSATIEPYPNGWYRCSLTRNSTATRAGRMLFTLVSSATSIRVEPFQANAGDGLYLWGAQLEKDSPFPSSFIPTTASGKTRSPDLVSIEGNKFVKTNLLEYSERFDQSAWTKQASVVLTPNSIAAPDGTTTGTLYSISASTDRAIDQSISSLTNGVTYTFSIYVKAIVNTTLKIRTQTDISTLFSGQILAADGWQRIQVPFAKNSSRTTLGFFDNSGSTGDRFYIWGAQLEEGDELTQYIPSVETFVSRASSATYVDDATGLIKTAPFNLLSYSEQFDQWDIGGGSSVTADQAVAPDGTNTADRVQHGSSGSSWIKQNIITLGNTYIVSVYAKAVTPGTNNQFSFNAGPGTNTDPFIATSEWQQFSATMTATGDKFYINNGDDSYITDVYFWSAQVQEGTTADPYIKTTSTPSGAARYENGELLLEPARTNKILRSENLVDSSDHWRSFNGATTTLSSVTAPDGVSNMWLVDLSDTPGASNVGSRVYQSGLAFNNVVNTFSFYARSVSGTGTFPVAYYDGSDYIKSYINLTETTQRYEISCPSGISTDGSNIFGFSRRGLTHDETLTKAYIWGCQVEAAPYASSYIPTTSSTVTRAADVSTSALGVNSWYNQSEGTVFVEAKNYPHPLTGKALPVVAFSDNTFDNRITLAGSTGNDQFNFDITVGGSQQRAILGNFASSEVKSAGGYKSTGSAGSLDGSAVVTSNTPNIPSVISQLDIGTPHTVSQFINGHISRLAYFPTRKTNQELIKLTGGSLDIPIITYGITSAGGTFNLRSLGTVDYAVDWDSTGGYESSTANTLAHTYTAGDYDYDLIVYSNDVYRPYFNNVTADASQITSVVISPGADLGNNLLNAWYGASNLTSFTCPFDVTNGVTSFIHAWRGTGLTSFPLIDTSSGTTFTYAWYGCNGLADFPANMFDTTGTLVSTAFVNAWQNCALTAQSIENILVSLYTNGASNITLGINGGTNAGKTTWSAAAVTAYDNLIVKGWTISFNA